MNLDDVANYQINKVLKGIDKEDQLQSIIHPDLNFRRNSINILVSRRGVGKTFAVMRELIKLSQLPDHGGYSQLIYVTEKINDSTENELINLIKLKTHVIKYDDAYKILEEIRESKTAYEQVTKNNLQDRLKEASRNEILNSLDVNEFTSELPHTICFFDDAINILKERKYLNLKNLLFQNRQPRFTIFICLQDFFSIPPQLKRNADSIWIFTGFTDKTVFGTLVKQVGSPISSDELWQIYNSLEYRDALIFEYSSKGIEIKNLFI
jgi:hypothetical protein